MADRTWPRGRRIYLRVVLRAKTRPRRLQDALRLLKMPQDAPRHPPDAPKTPQVAPRCRQEAPKRRPGGQLGSKNQEKSIKNGCRNIIPSRLHFLIDFWTIFAYNFVPRILKNRALAAGRARFLKNRLSKLISIFDQMSVPICIHFSIKNQSKIHQQSMNKNDKHHKGAPRRAQDAPGRP